MQKILVLASLRCWEHVGKVNQLQPHVIGQVSANRRLLHGEPTNEIVVVEEKEGAGVEGVPALAVPEEIRHTGQEGVEMPRYN